MDQCDQHPNDPQMELGPGGVPKGSKTSDFYRTKDLPTRLNNPEWFQGYGAKPQHSMYRTTASEYGSRPPSVHTMPNSFYGRSQEFSNHLGQCGMPRNHSLNTAMDQSRV